MPITQAQLWKLRLEIVLNSLYYSDYENSLGLNRRIVSVFFDGFLEFVEEEMKEDIADFTDNDFFRHLPAYDNSEYLWQYFCGFEEVLPGCYPAEEEESAA